MNPRRQFLLVIVSAFEIIAVVLYYYRGSTKNAAKADEDLTFKPPVVSIKCSDMPGKPCKWWPEISGIGVICVYSAVYPQKAIEAGALHDSEAECCAKYCTQQKRRENISAGLLERGGSHLKHQRQTRRTELPATSIEKEKILAELHLPEGVEKALQNSLKGGNVPNASIKHGEQCNQLMQQRANLQQQMSNIAIERKRMIHNKGEVTDKRRIIDEELNHTNKNIETLTNCTYSQLMMHLLSDGRLINDPTLPWNKTMYRPWLDPLLPAENRPSVMLLLTTKGWNQPDFVRGLHFARQKFETEFYSALVNHPYFHPTAWEDIESGKLDIQPHGVSYYVFPDVVHGKMTNYPIYGGDKNTNMDRSYYRTLGNQFLMKGCGNMIMEITSSRLFRELGVNSKQGGVVSNGVRLSSANLFMFVFRIPEDKYRSNCAPYARKLPIVVASLDGRFEYINEDRDQGMIPPLGKRVTLTMQEEREIETCIAETNKRFHVSYVGNFKSQGTRARSAYKDFHDNKRNIILRYFKRDEMKNSAIANMTYEEVLKNSEFALAPRGDNKYSFRFSEVLSAGAIPIYHADDYVYPFRPEKVDWHRCAIIFPEKMAGKPTLDYIANMTAVERCNRRKYCYFEIYQKYIETPMKQLDGYIEGLEAIQRSNGSVSFAGFRCNASSIESKDCYTV